MSREQLTEALPNYEIGAELGRGAMGEVFAGRHKRLDRDVAIKQLPPAFARDESIRSRFGDEARVLASLTHPHVVPIYDYVEEDGVCLLVMEALPGGTVWDRFTSDGFSISTVCAVVLATCAGLAHAHDRRVLHRDVKPENLMFDGENTLKVTDFGIATVLGGDEALATADGEIIGTPAYMAPEQAEGGVIGPEADVYAVGTMLYELLSGRLPFDESGDAMALLKRRLTDEPLPLGEVAPHVPEPLVAATMKAIARQPADRYSDPEALGVAIAAAAATTLGPDWRDRAQLKLMTAGPIAEAASSAAGVVTPSTTRPGNSVTLDRPSADARDTVAPGEAPDAPDGPATVGPDEVASTSHARDTVAPGQDDLPDEADGRETVAPGVPVPEGRARETVAAGAEDRLVTPAAREDGEGPRAKGPDLAGVAPEDMVRIADVLTPPERPWALMAATVVLGLAAALTGLTGLGSPDLTGDGLEPDQIAVAGVALSSGDEVAVDLAEPVPVLVSDPPAGVARAEVSLSIMGIPLGTSADAEVQPGPEGVLVAIPASSLRLGPSGPVIADLRLLDGGGEVIANREFSLDPDRAPHLSIGGAVSVLLALIFVAYGGSASAALRRGRRDRLAIVKLPVVGAIGGLAAALTGWSFLGTDLTSMTVLVAAALGAVTGALWALVLARTGRRRRIRRALHLR